MKQKEFIGRCTCDYRYKQLLQMISTKPIEEVLEIQQLNEKLNRNVRYQEIKRKIEERLNA